MSLSKPSFMIMFIVPLIANGQAITTQDSIEIKNQIEGFYTWYIATIKANKLDEDFNPAFVRQGNGMTTLDFKKYRDGLNRYKFTEDFIERKISGYKNCINNLKRIPFDKFSQYTDLDDFENIACDFGNRYEWTGGQEPKDKAELVSLKPVDRETVV